MSGIWQASGLLVLSLALSSIASIVLAADLDRIGARTGMSEGLVGIITAFGADAPEISSAVIALIGGRHDVGLGVALGSNIFNIAGLLGLSAVVAGSISIGHEILLFNGAIAAIVVGIIAALIFGMIAPITSVIILGVVVVVYIALSALRAPGIAQLGLPDAAERFLCAAITSAEVAAREDHTPPKAAFADALSVVPALVSIVLASVGMVHSALTIGHRWGISDTVIGVLILATLTGLPNVIAAVRLARAGRGGAVISEALNSNTFNALAGICLPALILGLGSASGQTTFTAWWLLVMTLLVLILMFARRGLSRVEGVLVIALYLVFVAIIIL